jgi:hypothetical protein
VQVE